MNRKTTLLIFYTCVSVHHTGSAFTPHHYACRVSFFLKYKTCNTHSGKRDIFSGKFSFFHYYHILSLYPKFHEGEKWSWINSFKNYTQIRFLYLWISHKRKIDKIIDQKCLKKSEYMLAWDRLQKFKTPKNVKMATNCWTLPLLEIIKFLSVYKCNYFRQNK